MPALAGFRGRITVNGTTMLRAHRVSINQKVDEFDVTAFENNANGDYIAGIQDFDITIDAYYDPTDNPFTTPLNLVPGAILTSVVIKLNKALGAVQQYSFPSLLVVTCNQEFGVRDTVHYSITAKQRNNNDAVPASGSVPSTPTAA